MVFELSLRPLLPSHFHLQLFLDKSICLNSELECPLYKHMSHHWDTVVTANIPILTVWIYGGCNAQVDDRVCSKWDHNLWPDETPFMAWCLEWDWGPGVLWEMAVETVPIVNDAQHLKPYDVFYEEKKVKDVFSVATLWGSGEQEACWGPWWKNYNCHSQSNLLAFSLPGSSH